MKTAADADLMFVQAIRQSLTVDQRTAQGEYASLPYSTICEELTVRFLQFING